MEILKSYGVNSPIEEQVRIVSSLDKKIEKVNKLIIA